MGSPEFALPTLRRLIESDYDIVGVYTALGDGDLAAGAAIMNAMPYPEAREHVDHPIACIDCHDPATMRLRITRPALIDGIARYSFSSSR